ncbi:hypothetical protein F2Q69_00002757 [Brassica cretica]|uniref:Uncharacterized protein n=1 Tax=Brassica cretica TaxID=69181 RepID=A0A8S9P6V8_BRACR|nr:hypothetical protein F2Q69_00002757 [Brassica cretica]
MSKTLDNYLTQLVQLGVSSSQLDRLLRFWADGPSPGQWWAVRSSHVAMVCWVSGQQQTPNPIRKGDEVLVAEEAQLLADGAHQLASRACSWGKTYPLIFYKYGGPPVDFIIQFQSKILREKRRERERERERVPAKERPSLGWLGFRRL